MSRGFTEHLGVAYLRAVLRRAGIASRQYRPGASPSLRGFADDLAASRPRVVGFTVYESNLTVSRAMVRAVRATLPECAVLVGGPNATFTPDETLRLVGADACVRGAGEGTIVSLVGAVLGSGARGRRFARRAMDVPNLVLATRDGNLRTPPGDLASFPAAHFRTLDDIPSPFLDGIVSTPEVGYLTARGCNQHCTFCSFAAASSHRVAYHGIPRVLDDLEAIEALVARTRYDGGIEILDDAFTLVPSRARQICEGILERGIRLRLGCETRADRVTPDLLALMRRAGFEDVAFGLESAVPRLLRTIGKVRPPGDTRDPGLEAEREYLARVRESVAAARRCGLEVLVSVMGGLPGETARDFQASLDFVASLGVPAYAHNVLNLLPGTPLHARRREAGMETYREPRTLTWRTVHTYDADSVPPRRGSTLHDLKWTAAGSLASALCGRPGPIEAGAGAAWAVVLHGCRRSPVLAAWLGRRLAIGGTVLVFTNARGSLPAWTAFLTRGRVPFGEVFGLVPDGEAGRAFRAVGSVGEHRVRFVSTFSPRIARTPVRAAAGGDCDFSVWLASAPDARVEAGRKRDMPMFGSGLQVGDSCRLGITPPQCSNPRVLHVDAEGRVRACRHGPVIEVVGERRALRVAASRAGTAGRISHCPLGPLARTSRAGRSRVWDADLASRLGWLFPAGRDTRGEVDPAPAGGSVT